MKTGSYTGQREKDRKTQEKVRKSSNRTNKSTPKHVEEPELTVKAIVKNVVSIKEAAEILGMSTETVRRAIKFGTLRAFRISTNGHWKIPLEEIEQFLSGKGE